MIKYKYLIMCGGTYPKWETPRQLLKFKGEPIICRTIRQLREHGIDKIAITANNGFFNNLGVPVLKHHNSYIGYEYNRDSGHWCDCFYFTDEPTVYLFGDVVFSDAAIDKIIETQTNDIAFFASAPPFRSPYPKPYVEPFAFKVYNTAHLHQAVEDVKRLDAQGRFHRRPIAWEVWNVISRGPDGDVNTIDYGSYIRINDYTCDIDKPDEIPMLERMASYAPR